MRRVVGVALAGLGAFLIVGALLCRFYLPGQVVKFPLNEYTVSRLSGTNVSYFSAQTGAEVNGATVHAISTTQGDVAAGNSSTAVWNNVTGTFDVTNSPQVPISYSTERFAFNRRTGALVNCCGAEVGTSHANFSGQGYVWPLGTQQQTYQVFNTSTMKPEPFNFTGTTTIDGLTVDVFVQGINNQQVGKPVTLPGSLVGSSVPTVQLPQYLTATNTYYVDPTTGAPVKVIEAENQTLQDPATGGTALVLFNGTLTSTPQTITAAVNTSRHYDTEISWVETVGPLIGILVGLLLLVLGILLINSYREEYEYEDDDEFVGAQA